MGFQCEKYPDKNVFVCFCVVCVFAATLTSYSENMERGGKYGEGLRGNLKLWQSQKSGMDSFLYRVDENMTASTYSLNKIPERSLESMSSHSAHSIPLYLMPRPNSVAGESFPFPLLVQRLKLVNIHAVNPLCRSRIHFLAKWD